MSLQTPSVKKGINMLKNSIILQTRFLLHKKEAIITFYILLILVLSNYVSNVMAFQGMDKLLMYNPMKMLLLSYNRVYYNASNTLILIQLYPILVTLPTGFSILNEKNNGTTMYLASRLGYGKYIASRLMSSFLVNSLIFVLPFALEIILNILSFPRGAAGDFSNLTIYSEDYINSVNNYNLKSIYEISPLIYAIIGTLTWGIFAGLLGMVTVALSTFCKIKYKIFAIFPVFFGLNLLSMFSCKTADTGISLRWYDYLLLFNDEIKNDLFIPIMLSFLLILSVSCIFFSVRKDCLC